MILKEALKKYVQRKKKLRRVFCFQQGEVVFGEDEGRGNRNEKLPSGRAWLPSCAHVRPSNSSSPVRHCIMSFNSVTSPARGVVTMKDRPTNVS